MVSNSLNIEVGDFLKVKRNSHKMQQKDFIKVINLSPAVVSRLEKGISPLTEKMAHRLDEAYGDTEVSDYLDSIESKRSGMSELVGLLQENYQSMDADAINTLRSFTKFMMNLKNPESNYKVEVVTNPPSKAPGSGSWRWIKRELRDEIAANTTCVINRYHISRSLSRSMGDHFEWETETEIFSSLVVEGNEYIDSQQAHAPVSAELLSICGEEGGILTAESMGTSRYYKDKKKGHFLFGQDQVMFIPLVTDLERKVFLILSGPSFSHQDFNMIKARAKSFIDKFFYEGEGG